MIIILKLLRVILFASNGLWSKNKLDAKDIKTAIATEFDALYAGDDNIIYIDYNEILDKVTLNAQEDANIEYSPQNLYFRVSYCELSEEFASCIVTTQSVVNDLESPNDLVDSNGNPKVEKLFNWSRWSKYIQKQNKLYDELKMTEGIDYLTRLGCELYFNM